MAKVKGHHLIVRILDIVRETPLRWFWGWGGDGASSLHHIKHQYSELSEQGGDRRSSTGYLTFYCRLLLI